MAFIGVVESLDVLAAGATNGGQWTAAMADYNREADAITAAIFRAPLPSRPLPRALGQRPA